MNSATDSQFDQDLRARMMVAAQYGPPAYVRRARGVEAVLESLLEQCRQKRERWLLGVRLHLGALRAGAPTWDHLRPMLASTAQLETLQRLREEAGEPAFPMTGPKNARGRLRILHHLRATIERFNRRWLAFIEQLDLAPVNALRDGYNRYYLLERECALGTSPLAPQLVRKLPPLTTSDVLAELPLLPTLQIATGEPGSM